MNYTSIEQSKKLLELGLSPETSDMFWQSNLNNSDRQYLLNMGEEEYFDIEINFEHCSIGDYDIPAWSLGALLDLLRSYNDCIKLDIFSNRSQKWQITISYYDIVWKEHEEININLLEAAYDTVVWLLENGYIETEKK